MSIILMLLMPCFFCGAEEPQIPAPIPALQMIEIPREQKIIEEKSLPSNASVGAGTELIMAQTNRFTTNFNQEATMAPNATQLYAFWLEPHEVITVTRTTDFETAISMRLMEPTKPHALTSTIKAMNRRPVPLRSRKMEFTNATDEIFKVVFLVYGRSNCPYKLEIERKLKK